jgi:hypothetical protein
MNMKRFQGVVVWLAAMLAFALLAGWSVHRDSPEGLLTYSVGQVCPAVSHGFSKVYGLMLLVAGCLALALAAASYVLAELGFMASGRDAMRSFAPSCLMFALGLGVFSVLMFPLEHYFPLSPRAPCVAPLPSR